MKVVPCFKDMLFQVVEEELFNVVGVELFAFEYERARSLLLFSCVGDELV